MEDAEDAEDTEKVEDIFLKNRFKVDEQTSGMKILFKVSLSKEKCSYEKICMGYSSSFIN